MEEVLISRKYSVVVPVATQEQARILGKIGAYLADAHGGEILALHVVRVPYQLTLGEGRLLLKEGRPYMETVIDQAKKINVPVHTVLRLGRSVADAVRTTVEENAAEMVVLGWPGYTNTAGRIFGSVIDPIVDDPPADIALVRYRAFRPLRDILVPIAGGRNGRRAAQLAFSMARYGENGPVNVTLLHVVPEGARQRSYVRAEQVFRDALLGATYESVETKIIEGNDVVESVLNYAKKCEAPTRCYDLIVLGATKEPLFKNLLLGNLSERIAQEADVTVIVVPSSNTARQKAE
jgi:CIC family chloride channel protein